MDVALFAAEATEGGIEPRPGRLPAAKETETLHRGLEWFVLRVESAVVGSSGAPHLVWPDWVEVSRDRLAVAVDERTLEEIVRRRVIAVIGLEASDRAGSEQHVGIETQN